MTTLVRCRRVYRLWHADMREKLLRTSCLGTVRGCRKPDVYVRFERHSTTYLFANVSLKHDARKVVYREGMPRWHFRRHERRAVAFFRKRKKGFAVANRAVRKCMTSAKRAECAFYKTRVVRERHKSRLTGGGNSSEAGRWPCARWYSFARGRTHARARRVAGRTGKQRLWSIYYAVPRPFVTHCSTTVAAAVGHTLRKSSVSLGRCAIIFFFFKNRTTFRQQRVVSTAFRTAMSRHRRRRQSADVRENDFRFPNMCVEGILSSEQWRRRLKTPPVPRNPPPDSNTVVKTLARIIILLRRRIARRIVNTRVYANVTSLLKTKKRTMLYHNDYITQHTHTHTWGLCCVPNK